MPRTRRVGKRDEWFPWQIVDHKCHVRGRKPSFPWKRWLDEGHTVLHQGCWAWMIQEYIRLGGGAEQILKDAGYPRTDIAAQGLLKLYAAKFRRWCRDETKW